MDLELQREIQEFKMPHVGEGDCIRWYATADRNKARMDIAWVLKVSQRNIHIWTAGHGRQNAVRHVDDPKLRLSPDQREMGAWEHSEQTLELQQIRRDLDNLMSGSGQQTPPAGQPVYSGQDSKTLGGFDHYRSYRSEALSLGIEFNGNPKLEWLKAEIAKKRQQPELVN